jgi:hypothetical protein
MPDDLWRRIEELQHPVNPSTSSENLSELRTAGSSSMTRTTCSAAGGVGGVFTASMRSPSRAGPCLKSTKPRPSP